MKNSDLYSDTIIRNALRSNKFFVIAATLVSIIVDVFATVNLYIDGIFTAAIILTVIAVLDLILLVAILKSNFRFAYSRVFPLIYSVLSLGVTAGLITITYNAFTTVALALAAATKILAVIALALGTFTAAKLGGKVKTAAVVSLIAFIAVCSVFSFSVYGNGYFGQGGLGYRNVIFELDEDGDGYVATGLMEGNGETVVIPNERNGKKISAVNLEILRYDGIKTVYFDCDTTVKLTGVEGLSGLRDGDLKVYIDKNKIDDFKQVLVEQFKLQTKTDDKLSLVSLMNNLIPNNLDDAERYVTFNYTVESVIDADYKLIKTWFGDSGEKFNLVTHATGLSYVGNYLVNDESFLYDRYVTNDKVLKTLSDGKNDINNLEITNNVSNVKVEFEDVYRVKIGDDNDSLYESDDSVKQFNSTGYRYVLGDDNGNLLSEFSREGFNLSWEYERDVVGNRSEFTSLSSILNNQRNVTVYPKWELKRPTINKLTLKNSDEGKTEFIYGDNVTITADATAPTDGLNLKYEWTFNSDTAVGDNNKNLSLTNVNPTKNVGIYLVKVTAYSSTLTSLTSSISESTVLKVGKKPIQINYICSDLTKNSNFEFTGTYKGNDYEITSTATAGVINGDLLNFETLTVRNYTGENGTVCKQTITNDCSNLYYIESGYDECTVIINKKYINVTWNDGEYTYNGEIQNPTASAIGAGSDILTVNVFDYSYTGLIDAGEHTVRASIAGTVANNYSVINSTKKYNIDKKTIGLTWGASFSDYNGEEQYSKVTSVSGVVSKDNYLLNTISYSGYGKNVGTYTITASLSDRYAKNYEINSSSKTHNYIINKKILTVNNNNYSLVYNGEEQLPSENDIVLKGLCGTDKVKLEFSSGHKNVVNSYGVTVSLAVSADGYANDNYQILTGNNKVTLTITKRPITVIWKKTTDFTYNGSVQKPEIESFENLANGETFDVLDCSVKSDKESKDVDIYYATANITNSNYEIKIGEQHAYAIVAKRITATWNYNSPYTYNKTSQMPIVTSVNELAAVDNFENLNLSYNLSSAVNAGDYQITVTSGNKNYVISNQTQSFKINPIELTVKCDNDKLTYNGNSQTPVFSVENNDKIRDGDVVDLTVEANAVNVGKYKATVKSDNANYTITNGNVDFEITVKKVDVTVKINGNDLSGGVTTSVTYAEKPIEVEITTKPEVAYNFVYKNASGVVLSDVPDNVGKYTLVISVSDTNYELTETEFAFEIVAPITEE